MRKAAPAILLILGVLIGYALSPETVDAQVNGPFVHGQTVTLTPETGGQVRCTVNFYANDFIGCVAEREIGADERQNFYNLRFIKRISPAPPR